MTSRGAWSMRYALLRFANAHAAAMEQYLKSQGNASIGQLVRIARESLAAPAALTERLLMAGPAMAPTLNARAALAASPAGAAAAAAAAAAARDAVEGLLLWRDPPGGVRVGDVVAFTAPAGVGSGYDAAYGRGRPGHTAASSTTPAAAPPAEATTTLVRRVAALPGDVLVDGDGPSASTLTIPPGHAWVLADAGEALPLAAAPDSRAFGPVPLSSIRGRVIYAAASPHDHGPVAGAPRSRAEDAEVVAAELDVDALAPPRPASAA